jgi:hypothetical protein
VDFLQGIGVVGRGDGGGAYRRAYRQPVRLRTSIRARSSASRPTTSFSIR